MQQMKNNKVSEIKLKMVHWAADAIFSTVIFCGLIFPGCSAFRHPSPLKQPATGVLSPSDEKSGTQNGNSFFFFAKSQLDLKQGDTDKAVQNLKQAIELDPNVLFLKRELAQLHWQRKEAEAADAIVSDLMSKDPDDIENLMLYARIKHGMNELDEAKSAYEKVIAKDPKQKNIYLLLGGLYMDESNPDFAVQVYQKLLKQFPEDFAGYYLMAQAQTLKRKPVEAEQNFLKALEIEPELDEARYELIALYKAKNRGIGNEKIIGLYLEMLARNPNNIRASMELGYFYRQIGRSAEADKIFTALGKRSLTDKYVIQHVLQFYLEQQKFDEALAILRQMLHGAPESSEIEYIIGIAYDGKKENEAAIHHLKRVDPDSRFFQNAVTHIAFLYQESGKTEEAIAYLEEVIDHAPRNVEPRLYLGALYEESELFEKAEAVLKEGIGIEPDNPKFFFRLGVVYDKWGKKDDSIAMMKEAVRIDPKDANSLNYLGYTYAEMGKNLDEAERLVREALKYKPDDGYIIDSLGWVYFKKGEYEKALLFLKKAIQRVPEDPTILEHLGDVYLKANNQKKALEFYQQSMMNATEGKDNLDKKIKELINLGY